MTMTSRDDETGVRRTEQAVAFACLRCGRQRPNEGVCPRCGTDSVHDLRSRLVRQMFEDSEARYQRERHARLIQYGAAIATVVLVLVWLTPGYWRHFAGRGLRTLIGTQFAIAVGVALAAIGVLGRILPKRRHSFLETLPAPDRD